MLTRNDLVALVGRDRYVEEAATARADAARPDYGRGGGAELDVPHDLQEHIWWQPGSWHAKIALLFAVYDDMPAYGHLMYAKHHYEEFSTDDRAFWWNQVIARVSGADPALSQPLAYSLWCDFFEDPDTVAEAWTTLTAPNVPVAVLKTALRAAGPVPYALKHPVYERLVIDPAWHEAILESLLYSAYDYFGQLDVADARVMLDRLVLAPSLHDQVQALRAKLD
jgi:hypothetical protein